MVVWVGEWGPSAAKLNEYISIGRDIGATETWLHAARRPQSIANVPFPGVRRRLRPA